MRRSCSASKAHGRGLKEKQAMDPGLPRASRELLVAVKTARLRQYELARRAGLDPALVSKIIHNAIPLRPNDVRVRRLARAVGLRVRDAFESSAVEPEKENRAT